MKKARRWLVVALQTLRGVLPVVLRKFPQLALWAGAIYAVIDILLKLIG